MGLIGNGLAAGMEELVVRSLRVIRLAQQHDRFNRSYFGLLILTTEFSSVFCCSVFTVSVSVFTGSVFDLRFLCPG